MRKTSFGSALPTRKMWTVIFAYVAISSFQGFLQGLTAVYPDVGIFGQFLAMIDVPVWAEKLAAGAGAWYAAYETREKSGVA